MLAIEINDIAINRRSCFFSYYYSHYGKMYHFLVIATGFSVETTSFLKGQLVIHLLRNIVQVKIEVTLISATCSIATRKVA